PPATNPTAAVRIAPELIARSDWDRHEATLTLRGSYESTFDGVTTDAVAGSIDGALTLELSDQWTADMAAGYGYSQQSVTDPDTPAGLDARPGIHDLDVRGTLAGGAGRVRLSLGGTVARTYFEDGLSGGVPVDQGDRGNNRASATARIGYRLNGALTPFVEAEIARRQYDRVVDNNGLRRSTTEMGYRAGIAMDRAPVLTGELAVGMRHAIVDDVALANIAALTVDGSLIWAPSALTTVTFNAATAISPTTDIASSGSVTRGGSVTLAYAWRPNFSVSWEARLSHQAFQGTGQQDWRAGAGVQATWRLSRVAQLNARYDHAQRISSDASNNTVEHAVRLGLRIAR
ncbi:MAG: outer membrane beta-barrel protein, partial [Alphaproteobacteria bacterium]